MMEFSVNVAEVKEFIKGIREIKVKVPRDRKGGGIRHQYCPGVGNMRIRYVRTWG